MLSQKDVTRMWRQLFQGSHITNETIAKAEDLLSALSPENPLRHRLRSELVAIQRANASSDPGRKG